MTDILQLARKETLARPAWYVYGRHVQRIRELAKEKGLSESDVVRQLLDYAFAQLDAGAEGASASALSDETKGDKQ